MSASTIFQSCRDGTHNLWLIKFDILPCYNNAELEGSVDVNADGH